MRILSKIKSYKKIALALSLLAILVWAILGTGASLAWFSDTSPRVKNIFHFADFDLSVSYRLDDGKYKEIEGQTEIFNQKALYEPGYVQVVYLKIVNLGDVPFNFKTAVSVNDYNPATNVFGQEFLLQEHLKFGVAIADTEQKMDEAVKTRTLARAIASSELGDYETKVATLHPNETSYIALVVHMPENVTNVANYRTDNQPWVELGVIVTAEQIKKQ